MAGRVKPWAVDDEVGGGGVVVLLEHRLVEESQVLDRLAPPARLGGRPGSNSGTSGASARVRWLSIEATTPAIAELLAWAAAVLSAIAAAAGLLSSTLYRDAPFWAEQARGIDLATLFLAVPTLVISLWLSQRASAPARGVPLGVVLYLAYNYAIYTTSIVMNRLALVYIAILGLSVWALVLLASDAELAATAPHHSPRRVIADFLLLVALLFEVLWLSQIASSTISGVPPADLKRAGLPANPVYALDLAIFLPLAVVAAIGLLRRNERAAAFAVPMLIWIFLTSAGIAGGFFFRAMAGEQVPAAVAIVVGFLGIFAAILSGLALRGANA